MKLVFNITDYADIADVEIGIRVGDPTCCHYAAYGRRPT